MMSVGGKNDKNEIKKQVIYLYVCYPPGLEDGVFGHFQYHYSSTKKNDKNVP